MKDQHGSPARGAALIPAVDPVACLEALAAALRTHGWIAQLAVPPGHPAFVHVQNPRDDAMSARVLAAPGPGVGTSWYWFAWTERIAPAGAPAAAAAEVSQALDRGTSGDGVTGLGRGDGDAATPGRALMALRAELAGIGVTVTGMTVTRLSGTLTVPGGLVVRYCCGWLMWSAGRPSRRRRPLQAIHSAHDPSGAALKLASAASHAGPTVGPGARDDRWEAQHGPVSAAPDRPA
jgi:hypothetical protein